MTSFKPDLRTHIDKMANVYAMTTLILSNAANQLNKLEPQAQDSHLLEPLTELQTEILLALEKFQKAYLP